jgi:hypothetical protein
LGSLEIIGAGFGRTGTMSLKVALEKLGPGPCYHLSEVFANPDHVAVWESAMRGERADWWRIFREYRAAVDWPAAAFYEELMERYPDARVILTVRDPDRWYESARSTIYTVQDVASSPLFSLAALFVPRLRRLRRAAAMAADLVWTRTFDGRFEDREYAKEVFVSWNREVERRVPAERLLVYEVREGWGPLCEFLGVEAPIGEPFPHLNEGEAFRRTLRRARAAVTASLAGVSALGMLALLYGVARRRSMPGAKSVYRPVWE